MEPERRFREMFVSTYPALCRYARHRGLSGQDVDDLVAATYEVAWRRLERVPAGEGTLPWLLAVALNHLRNRRRRLERDRRLVERLGAPEQASSSETGGYEWREIRHALDRLSRTDRELVLLVAWDELSPAQAAKVLGLSPGAARTRLHRARTRLGALLRRGGDPEVPGGRAELGQAAAIQRTSR